MNVILSLRQAGFIAFCAMTAAVLCASPSRGETRVKLIPVLRAGETLRYEIRGRVQRHMKEQSHVGTISTPGDVQGEIFATLVVNIRSALLKEGRPVIDAEGILEYPPADAAGTKTPAPEHRIDFTIGGNGQLLRAEGLDALGPVERIAWEFWISRFAFGWTLPEQRWKQGETWKNEEPENHPSPVGRLVWERSTTMGESQQCPLLAGEDCVTFYTSAVLKQKSSTADSTPDDYKLHALKTSGSVAGTNETYTVISQNTGLAMRGTEQVKQSMNVVIAMADASNAVKYEVEAGSHFEMVIVSAR